MTPKTTAIRQDDTHRLIPARYSDESVLSRLADSEESVSSLFDLESATNERLLGEMNLLPGITVHELLFGVPYARIVNAAFTYAPPAGHRFSGSDRGAWYAAFELKTSEAEVAFHKAAELAEIGWQEPETFTFDDYMADFRGDFHDLRHSSAYEEQLSPDHYRASQKLGRTLLAMGSSGIVYPSVRRRKGTCLVCFRPALVTNVRLGCRVTMKFKGGPSPPVITSRTP